jgi:hypothetical protein
MNKDAGRPAGCRGEAWLKKGSAQLEVGCPARGGRRLARRSHPDPRGPGSDAVLGSHDVRAAGRSEFSEAAELEGFKVWPAVRCPGGRPDGADTKAPPLPRAPSCITERAAAHSLQFGTYALSAAGLLAALAVRPVPSCALIIPRAVND